MKIKIYKREKPLKTAKRIKIEFNPNLKTFARINTPSGIIEINKTFLDKTPLEKNFILLHELGHYLYKTEHKCDFFASSILYANGISKNELMKLIIKLIKDKDRILKDIKDIKEKL